MQTFLQFTEGYINFGDYNLEQKFHYYNSLLFQNAIPPCPVVWADMKGVAGLTTFTHRGKELVPGTLKIQLSTHFKCSMEMLDSTLIHEMIHAFLAAHGRPDENHGWGFRLLAQKCGEKVGLEIRITDKLSDLELTDAKDVETTAMLRYLTRSKEWGAIFYNGTMFDHPDKQKEALAYWGRPGILQPGEEILVTKVYGSYMAKYGAARVVNKNGFKLISPKEAEQMLQHGKILFKITPGCVTPEEAKETMPSKEVLVVFQTNTRNGEVITTFYMPNIARDPAKLMNLKAKWEEYHRYGYNIEIFLTTTTLMNHGYVTTRDVKTSGTHYRLKPDKVEDLRRNAKYLERLMQ